jgi:prepilin-type N-terminal cleavage/methylation domain-containing protein
MQGAVARRAAAVMRWQGFALPIRPFLAWHIHCVCPARSPDDAVSPACRKGDAVGANRKGFTLVELMIVVVVIGLLAAIAIPNYMASEARAREAGVKSNMHTFQLAAEDFRVKSDSTYAGSASAVASLLQGTFRNPFDQSTGVNNAWEDRAYPSTNPSTHSGIVSYADSLGGSYYNVKGYGSKAPLTLTLTNGR